MKKLLLPLLLLFSISCFSQNRMGDFTIVNDSLHYNHLLTIHDSINNYHIQLTNTEGIDEVNKEGSVITANLNGYKIDHRKINRNGSTPSVAKKPIFGKVNILKSEEGYNITVTDLQYEKNGVKNSLSEYSLSGGKFDSNPQKITTLQLLDKSFQESFAYNEKLASTTILKEATPDVVSEDNDAYEVELNYIPEKDKIKLIESGKNGLITGFTLTAVGTGLSILAPNLVKKPRSNPTTSNYLKEVSDMNDKINLLRVLGAGGVAVGFAFNISGITTLVKGLSK